MENDTRGIKVYIINYLYIACLLLWGTMQSFVCFDGAGRIPALLCLYVIAVNKDLSNWIIKAPFVFWLLWTIYSILNLYIQGTPMQYPELFYMRLIENLIVLCVSAKEFGKNRARFVNFVLFILFVYSFLNIMNGRVNSSSGRFSTEEGNLLPISMVFLSFISLLSYVYKKRLLLTTFLIMYSGVIIVSAATRKAFGALILVVLLSLIPKLKLNTLRGWLILFCSIIIGLLTKIMISSSALMERLDSTQEQASYAGRNLNWFLVAMGDRADQYIKGWQIFLDNYVCGIGLANFYNMGYGNYMLHTEYMVQLAEGGAIGIVFFLFLYMWIIFSFGRLFFVRKVGTETWCHVGALAAILFMSFTAWTYSFPIYFIVLGIIISYCENNEKNCYIR